MWHVRRQIQTIALAGLFLLSVLTLSSSSFRYGRNAVPSAGQSAVDTAQLVTTASTAGLLQRLELALEALERTPIATYDEALALNEQTCDGRESQSNPDQIKGESEFWRNLARETLFKKRTDVIRGLRDFFGLPGLRNVPPEGLLESPMYGVTQRGLVFTGGNKDTLQRIANSLRILRLRHNCQLPVEIFAFPQELALARGQAVLKVLEDLGNVSFRELHSSNLNSALWKNFQIKAESIVKSSFSEVLYLDSDNVLLADPTYLFDHTLYKQNGAVFWPDITKDGPANPIWRTLSMQCRRQDWQLDSGQILIDKRGQDGMNLAGLVAAQEMQKDYDFWFKISGGDKDTFRYGFYFLNLAYSVPPSWLSSFGPVRTYETNGHNFCGLAMVQHSLSRDDWQHFPSASPSATLRSTHAPPLFVHANLLKHSSGSRPGQVWTTVKRMREDRVAQDNDRFRSTVYHSKQGMCVDIWDSFDTVNPRPGGTFSDGDVIMEDADSAFGGALKGFDEMYWAEGGKAGGF